MSNQHREILTTEIIKKRAQKVHGDKYDLSILEFISCKQKIKYICPRHGIVHQVLFDFLNGHGCKKCHFDGTRKWSLDQDEFLKQHYKDNGAYWCAEQLDKTEHSVRGRASVIGLNTKQRNVHPNIPSYMWSNLIKRAEKSGYIVDIDEEFIWDMFLNQDKKCALTGWEIQFSQNRENNTASIDRIDSNKHYTKDNIQLTHKIVNRCKLNCPEELFYNICKSVAEYRKNDFIKPSLIWEWDIWNDTERPRNIFPEFDNNNFTLKNSKIVVEK